MGNQFQRSRKMVTVGLYTARKPVEASSRMCRANARHSANHAPPKPDAESADSCLTGIVCHLEFSITNRTIGNRKSAVETAPIGAPAMAVSVLPRHFAHQRQQISLGVAEKRHP